jgi:hypothetical protein
MLVLTVLTVSKYSVIKNFRSNSQIFTVEIEGDELDVQKIRSVLQDMTFQDVEEDCLGDRRHRLTLRCPPEKLSFLLERAGIARHQ